MAEPEADIGATSLGHNQAKTRPSVSLLQARVARISDAVAILIG